MQLVWEIYIKVFEGNVLHIKVNLFSVNCSLDKDYIMTADGNSCKLSKGGLVMAYAKRENKHLFKRCGKCGD